MNEYFQSISKTKHSIRRKSHQWRSHAHTCN